MKLLSLVTCFGFSAWYAWVDITRYFVPSALLTCNIFPASDSASNFKYLYAYSPLHNISKDKNYPATLVITSDHDDRVVPAHSFKYAATMQELYKGKNPMLIRIDTNSGHGMSNMMKSIELSADIYAFTLYNMGEVWKK